ncbi:MAG: homocysteine S-methyltransferase family protein [Lachnospiraceae bacterium]|nr:homocysteine S-methyltransferase family protein [Lachnospiraceae bacterium]
MILDRLGKELLFFDGGMGSLLQEKGMAPGELPETWNITRAEDIIEIHQNYIAAGSDILLTNTFGANAIKYDGVFSLEEVVFQAVANVKEAMKRANRKVSIALDVGSVGKLLKPMGELEFEDAFLAFSEVVKIAVQAGVDLIHIETMSDSYELKAAVLAAKESGLPVFATVVFDEKGRLLTGADVKTVVALLEGLRVDALGINCGMGPRQMLPLLKEIRRVSSLPIVVKPNAGLPKTKDGQVFYDVGPDEFALIMEEVVDLGAAVIGGCCGATPTHIQKLVTVLKGKPVLPLVEKQHTYISSYNQAVELGTGSKIIGERINPTGKKKLKEALRRSDFDYILNEAYQQERQGAHILDVNVGLPDINECRMMVEVIKSLQAAIPLPLQIDTVDIVTMEQALRYYNGKAMVNSVNGKQESMDAVFPLIQKYGGVVVALTLDESGIPETVEGRLAIARKLIDTARKYGISQKDIVIDVLALTISSDPQGAKVTLETLRRVREELGVNTILGVSNISFGLPKRPIINSIFYALAMENGLSAGIINPGSEDMMKAYYAYHALHNLDENCANYIQKYALVDDMVLDKSKNSQEMTLKMAIEKGFREEAEGLTKVLCQTQKPLEIINTHLIPALDFVGKGFETGSIFLPQLLMSAEAAKRAFAVLKEVFQDEENTDGSKEKIILATVHGDIHDIGKNIVKVLLENYGFEIIDLGKDVPPEEIVSAAIAHSTQLVGLSALMTTTVVNMEETIRQLRQKVPTCKIMVGGAVLNQEYADMIDADFYGKDALQSVHYAKEVFKGL